MKKITFDQIRKTYQGRRGCGCVGAYTLPSHVSIEEANKQTGYVAYDASSVSDRRAKIAMNKVNKAIDKYGLLAKETGSHQGTYQYRSADVWFCYSDVLGLVVIDNLKYNFANDRTILTTAVYFKK
jgi:hypothetical protein